ncbi:type II toxin-antitoxin system YoeB family toxin [Campylobacter gastrosuis]|uniref:Type II toxin-antitoxin system YoeB family toxin n=1 Tax=Campylobacter gastrosuis TaxID=2974576 RepID=A0ABT7HSP5_9BACT|nr:type II toxin-antitoxin system YoeB family toxin [Campylobacter gastrosuis]MDL0089859.1 type II toxin-antitoxin system YoeB family toxin [Campylobacter gastrosuis]
MNKKFSDKAWADYLYWQENDKKKLKRINALI